MRVGWDLDGVLYDFGNSVRRYLASVGREYDWKDGAEEPHTWNFFEHWNMPLDEFVSICNDGVDSGYVFCGPTRPYATWAVEQVARLGHEIIIITDRQFGSDPRNSHNATCEWLAQHGIEYDELIFSSDKTCVPTDMFVEDKLENYDALTAAGVKTYLIDRPWNQVPGGDGRNRISCIRDYVDAVETATMNQFFDLSMF